MVEALDEADSDVFLGEIEDASDVPPHALAEGEEPLVGHGGAQAEDWRATVALHGCAQNFRCVGDEPLAVGD